MTPNEALRERFQYLEEKEGLTLADVAARLGWECMDKRTQRPKPDSSRVARSLGLVKENGKVRTHLSIENATSLCRALNADPLDVGL